MGLSLKTLQYLQDEVFLHNTNMGWQPDPDRTFGDEVALIHSEASEALEAYRVRGFERYTAPIEHREGCEDSGDNAPNITRCTTCGALGKPDDVASELADIFIRVLHYSRVHGFDLEYEYERKMAYNRTRKYRHGGKRL